MKMIFNVCMFPCLYIFHGYMFMCIRYRLEYMVLNSTRYFHAFDNKGRDNTVMPHRQKIDGQQSEPTKIQVFFCLKLLNYRQVAMKT